MREEKEERRARGELTPHEMWFENESTFSGRFLFQREEDGTLFVVFETEDKGEGFSLLYVVEEGDEEFDPARMAEVMVQGVCQNGGTEDLASWAERLRDTMQAVVDRLG